MRNESWRHFGDALEAELVILLSRRVTTGFASGFIDQRLDRRAAL